MMDNAEPMFDLPEQMVTQPEELAECCAHIAACKRFGFDTEFVGEDTYHPRLCLVQVATAERLILIDPMTVGPLESFWKLVVDPENLVVVHAGREEVRLCRLWTGAIPGNLFDLQIAAGLAGFAYPLGHATLVNQILDIRLSKMETLTEWRDRPLTPQQVRYAFDDVRYLLPIWLGLSARLDQLGRSIWAKEEFGRLAGNAAPEEPTQEKWRKLRGLGSLDRRRLAIVRELYQWREETAERTNRPARTIVRDDLLIEIARRNPHSDRDMHVIRGLPKRDLPAILEAVARAREIPNEECPTPAEREQDPTQFTLLTNILNAVLGNYCAQKKLAPNLVANGQDIKLLVRARIQGETPPEESILTRGWRAEHILPFLRGVLEGKFSLRITDPTADSPIAVTEVLEQLNTTAD